MPDLQIFIISPPDNLIMQRTRIHFAPLRKPARAALSSDYFPALRAALYKPTRTPSIMLVSPAPPRPPVLKALKLPCSFCLGLECVYKDPQKGGSGEEHLGQISTPSCSVHLRRNTVNFFFFLSCVFFFLKKCFKKFLFSLVCITVMHHLS